MNDRGSAPPRVRTPPGTPADFTNKARMCYKSRVDFHTIRGARAAAGGFPHDKVRTYHALLLSVELKETTVRPVARPLNTHVGRLLTFAAQPAG